MINNEVKQDFNELLQIIDIQQYNNAMVVAQYLMECAQKHNLTLAEAESLFRHFNSRVYLVGLPLEFFETCQFKAIDEKTKKPKFMSMFQGQNKKFGVWIEMNGKDALEKVIAKCEKVDRELNDTGFLTVNKN